MANKEALKNASANALDKFFSQGAVPSENPKKNAEAENIPSAKEKAPKIENKAFKEVFSFRAEGEQVVQFRSYCEAKYGMKIDEICTQAMLEYINNHPLEKFEQEMYNKALEDNRAKMQMIREKRKSKNDK